MDLDAKICKLHVNSQYFMYTFRYTFKLACQYMDGNHRNTGYYSLDFGIKELPLFKHLSRSERCFLCGLILM